MSFDHLNGVMFDIETLGRRPGCAILSIGACRFSIDAKKIYDKFYVTLNIQDSLAHGLSYDKETIRWWRDQNPKTLKGIQRTSVSVREGLNKFYEYLSKKSNEPLWAWGSHFDVPIIQEAMTKILDIDKMPWKYYNVFDARTICNVFGVGINRDDGIHHNALDDAIAQAKYIVGVFTQMTE